MSAKRSMSDDSKSDAAAQARSYPRKRVSIACEVCRLRKTRCDAAKPACSFCADLGIECVYKRPADASRPEPRSEELAIALKRLDKIETTLESIAHKVGAGEPPHRFQPPPPEPSPFVSTPLAFRNEPVTPSPASVSTAARLSRHRFACKGPNLFTFKHPLPEHSDWSYNCTESFFTDQMDVIADMQQHLHLPHPNPDLSEVHLKQLQISFAENVLKWLPLFDPDTAMQHIRYARSTDYQHTGPSLCLVFLVYANGAISQDTSLYSRSAHELPGFAYYAKALSILNALPAPTKDLTILQCRVLVAIYLLFAMRPLEAWRNITQASQECIILLRANAINDTSIGDLEQYRGAFNRIYWICYVLENELEACLEVPSSGIRQYESQVPLPTSHYEEDGMYFLLALSSLRKVMVEVLDTVGYKSSTNLVSYNPAVALELRSQIDAWYHHLPAPLRFPLDGPPLFDIRKAYLRCCYYALTAVGTWPFVISLSQAPNIQTPHSMDYTSQSRHNSTSAATGQSYNSSNSQAPSSATESHHQHHRSTSISISTGTPAALHSAGIEHEPSTDAPPHHYHAGQTCLEACRLYLHHAEEILTHKCLVSHLIVRQYFAFTVSLILTFGGVDLQNGGSLEERRVLENAMRNLGYWGVVPFMVPSLREMRRIASDRGLGRGGG